MKEIQLSCARTCKNTGEYVALIDDEDFERVNQFPWHVTTSNGSHYAKRNVYFNKRSTLQSLHQFILGEEGEIDHVDRNGLNCQRLNMRKCTHHQNSMNRGPDDGSASAYKGVVWHKKNKKWMSQIMLSGKQFYLGCFDNEIEAAKAVDKKAKELFGEFAYLNFNN